MLDLQGLQLPSGYIPMYIPSERLQCGYVTQCLPPWVAGGHPALLQSSLQAAPLLFPPSVILMSADLFVFFFLLLFHSFLKYDFSDVSTVCPEGVGESIEAGTGCFQHGVVASACYISLL